MATFQSSGVLQPFHQFRRQNRPLFVSKRYEFTTTTPPAAGDIYEMVPVAPGMTVWDLIGDATDMDSGTALRVNIGDGADRDRYVGGSSMGSAGFAIQRKGAALPFTYTVFDTIDIEISVGPTTGVNGTFGLFIVYSDSVDRRNYVS